MTHGEFANIKELHFEEINSTHGYAVEHHEDFPETTIITTDFQSEGRGRRGRNWLSPPKKSLLSTIVFKDSFLLSMAPKVSLVLSLAVVEYLKDINIRAEVVWPNDIFIDDKKIAGILSEAVLKDGKVAALVLSLGLNVNQRLIELESIETKATSMAVELNQSWNIDEVKKEILSLFWPRYHKLINNGFNGFINDYNAHLGIIDKKIVVDYGQKRDVGLARGVNENGNLILELTNGVMTTCSSGEVVKIYQ